MRSFRTWSALPAVILPLALAACSDPSLRSNLVTAGPPDVTMVSIFSEGAMVSGFTCDTGDNIGEQATYCAQGADLHVSTGWCPVDRDPTTDAPIAGKRTASEVMDAVPDLWHARVVFSELLDPSIEELRQEDRDGDGKPDDTLYGHIEMSHPFEIKCGTETVAYDGFYDPTGNDLSCPPGPALVVNPTDFTFATGDECTVTLNDNIKDKDGNAVPSNERGPYKFTVAGLELLDSSPADGEGGVDPASPLALLFNAPVDPTSAAGKVTLADDGGNPVTVTAASAADPTILVIQPSALAANTVYHLTVTSGITDANGGVLTLGAPVTITFMTAP